MPLPDTESLAPAPPSRWGRMVSRTYLVIAAGAALLMVRELVANQSGLGTMALSLLTAPWSVLLSYVAQAVAPGLAPGTMRVIGLVLMLLAVLLNARILSGMAARAERDVRAARTPGEPGGPSHG